MKERTVDDEADRESPTPARPRTRHGVASIRVDVARVLAARRALSALALRFPELRGASARARLATTLDAETEASHGD